MHPYHEDLFHWYWDDVKHNRYWSHYSTKEEKRMIIEDSLMMFSEENIVEQTLAVDGALLSRIFVSNMILFERKCSVAVFYYL